MSEPITRKIEAGLKAYLEGGFQGTGEPLAGLTIYEGHTLVTKEAPDHLMITAVEPGGDLAYAGIYEVRTSLTVVTSVFEQPGDTQAPEVRHYAQVEALAGIFSEAQMMAAVAALNAPAEGPDARPVTGWGCSCFERLGMEEARNEKVLATRLVLNVVAHLE